MVFIPGSMFISFLYSTGADIQTGDAIYSRFLPYHQNVHGLKIQVSDPFGNGHILNNSLVYNEDEIGKILSLLHF